MKEFVARCDYKNKILNIYSLMLENFIDLFKKSKNNHGGFLKIKLSLPYKSRTTGEKSQNNHIYGHIVQICNYTGDDIEYFKYQCKLRAIKRGYPYRTNIFGDVVPYSTTEINTIEAGYLIDQLHEDAAFIPLVLKED